MRKVDMPKDFKPRMLVDLAMNMSLTAIELLHVQMNGLYFHERGKRFRETECGVRTASTGIGNCAISIPASGAAFEAIPFLEPSSPDESNVACEVEGPSSRRFGPEGVYRSARNMRSRSRP